VDTTRTARRQISLAHLTVLDTTSAELVTFSAAAGFGTIGIRLTATPSVGIPPYDVLSDGPLLRETLLRLSDTGGSDLPRPLRVVEGPLRALSRMRLRRPSNA
jgi:hypothetical protein